jgi:(4-O-methyl)-D-glucuronate---lignin esterase
MYRLPALFLAAVCLGAQQPQANYDEAKVPPYTLPDPLTMRSGEPVKDSRTWTARRRPEILALYETEVYGRSPARPPKPNYEVASVDKQALGGMAVRKLVTLYFGDKAAPRMNLLVYLPAAAKKPAPMFVGLSFNGIHAVSDDPGVPLAEQWVRDPATKAMVKRRAAESTRGAEAQRWQVRQILGAGYGLAVAYYGDIEPDFDGGMKDSVRPLFFKPGQTAPAPDEWAAIGAWAWSLRCAMDYLERDRDVDAKHVAVMGHSRLGKTALWAGALDTRFSVVISNESGEGGAAISRRLFGERTRDLNSHFPHWFDANYRKYDEHEDQMPFDSNLLLSLIAPRGLYVASAVEDQWSDPKGEFLAAAEASKVWALFGKKGIGTM